MTHHEQIPLAKTRSNDKRPFFLNDADVEKVMSTTMSLASEVAVLRERLDTVERLLEKGEPVTRQSIESYVPDESVTKEREDWHTDYISRILRLIKRDMESV